MHASISPRVGSRKGDGRKIEIRVPFPSFPLHALMWIYGAGGEGRGRHNCANKIPFLLPRLLVLAVFYSV